MKLYQYLSSKKDCNIRYLTLTENDSYIINQEANNELYDFFNHHKGTGYHQLTYSLNNEGLCSEFYCLSDEEIDSCIKGIHNKMNINYLDNSIIISLFTNDDKMITIKFDLTYEYNSCELSQLLKQREIPVHILSKKKHGLHKEGTVNLSLNEKHKAIILEYIELFLNYYNIIDGKNITSIEDMIIKRKFTYLNMAIQREDIEELNVSKYQNILSSFYPSVLITHDICERLQIKILGYEEDNRELWQIPQVRRFFELLNESFPYWFYFLDKKTDNLYFITMCLCSSDNQDKNLFSMESLLFNDFLNEQFKNLNEVLYYINDYSKEKEITERVFQYYNL